MSAKLHKHAQNMNYNPILYILKTYTEPATTKPNESIITITLSRLPSVRVYARLLLQA